MRKNTTVINEEFRALSGLTRDEYALCQYVQYRLSDPRTKAAGWCDDRKEDIANFIGVTRAGLYKMVGRMDLSGYLEVHPATGFYRVTAKWIDGESQRKASTKLTNDVNKVYKPMSTKFTPDVNKVDVQYRGIVRVSKNKGDGEEKEKAANAATPAAENDFLTLEANTKSLHESSAAGPVAPRPSDKPQGVEFHTDLVKQIGQFYKAHPHQWTDDVKQGPGSRYTNEQLVSMLDDYCSHCFAHRDTYATFARHHGNFIRWIKNQKQFERRTEPDLSRPEKQAEVTRFYNQIPVTK